MAESSHFEVWVTPGGCVWVGRDQEEALLAAVHLRQALRGVTLEVFEVRGDLYTRVARGIPPRA